MDDNLDVFDKLVQDITNNIEIVYKQCKAIISLNAIPNAYKVTKNDIT